MKRSLLVLQIFAIFWLCHSHVRRYQALLAFLYCKRRKAGRSLGTRLYVLYFWQLFVNLLYVNVNHISQWAHKKLSQTKYAARTYHCLQAILKTVVQIKMLNRITPYNVSEKKNYTPVQKNIWKATKCMTVYSQYFRLSFPTWEDSMKFDTMAGSSYHWSIYCASAKVNS